MMFLRSDDHLQALTKIILRFEAASSIRFTTICQLFLGRVSTVLLSLEGVGGRSKSLRAHMISFVLGFHHLTEDLGWSIVLP